MAHWVDILIQGIATDRVVINDSKTPSGRVHVGSLRGPIVHDMIYRAAKDAGKDAHFYFGIDDYDPFDSVPPYLPEDYYSRYLGQPLSSVPSHIFGEESYARQYSSEFIDVMNELGVWPDIYYTSNFYLNGTFDKSIDILLSNAEEIRTIYFEVSGSRKPQGWMPFHVICENCGKISTTLALSYQNGEITYVCNKLSAETAPSDGCGYNGTVSPFGGTGKLPWKLEWAAKWNILSVTVEGAGKDHSVAGGSRDVSEEILKRIFHQSPPINAPYEFLLFNQRKMSSSQGVGLSAREVANVLPPEILRFALVRTRPRKVINFDLDGIAIPRLFDEYDKAKNLYLEGRQDTDHLVSERNFHLSLVDPDVLPSQGFMPKFRYLATIIQIPENNIYERMASEKGAELTPVEREITDRMSRYARIWLDSFAPSDARLSLTPSIPDEVTSLNSQQLRFLEYLASEIDDRKPVNSLEMHNLIHAIAEEVGISKNDAFCSVYISFLGKEHGPRAGELLSALDMEFVVKRLVSACDAHYIRDVLHNTVVMQKVSGNPTFCNYLIVNREIINNYPQLRIGAMIIKDVTIGTTSDELEHLRRRILTEIIRRHSSHDVVGIPQVTMYRDIYKAMGINAAKNRPSSEALLRRVLRDGDLPRINTVVDAYNLMSAEYLIPMAAYDLDKISLPVELRLSEKKDLFRPIGGIEDSPIEDGRVVYADQQRVICLDFNYRDSEITKVTEQTRNLLVIVDGYNYYSVDELQEIVETLAARIVKYNGGMLDGYALVVRENR